MANELSSRFNPFLSREDKAGADQYISETRIGELPALGETTEETGETMIATPTQATENVNQAGFPIVPILLGAGAAATPISPFTQLGFPGGQASPATTGQLGRFMGSGMKTVSGTARTVPAVINLGRAAPTAAAILGIEEAPKLLGSEKSTSEILTEKIMTTPEMRESAASYAALGADLPGLGPVNEVPQEQENAVEFSLPSNVQPGSPQARFLEDQARLAEAGQELSPAQIAQAEEFARSMGTTFDPETGYSRQPFLSEQASRTGTPMPGQTLSQFMRYEDQPEQRTEQFVDPQGRLRRRMTPTAAALAGLPSGVQPLSPEYNSFEQAGAMREARIAARPDFNRAVSDRERRGGQLSQADIRDLVQAERPGATVGEQARALELQQRAGMGEVETKSPEEEELDRARKQASIDFMRAQTAQMTQEPSEAEIAKQELEIKILEQQYKDAGFAPVAVETDPQTGATVQVYRNPEGEERRLFKTGPRSGTRPGADAFGAIVGGGPAQPSTVVGGGPAPIPTITSQEEYDNLEKGAQYLDSQGRLATKKS